MAKNKYEEQYPAGTRVRVIDTYVEEAFTDTEQFVGLEGTVLDYAEYEVYIGVKLDKVPEGLGSEYSTGLLVTPEEIERI